VPVFHEDGRLALDKEEYLRPRTTLEGLAALKPAFPAVADFPLDDKGTTDRGLVLQKISRSRDQPYSACRQFVRRRISSNPAGVAELRQKAGSEAARQGRRNGEHGRFANTDAERASARHSKGARKGRPWQTRLICSRSMRHLPSSRRNTYVTSNSIETKSTSMEVPSRSATRSVQLARS
jgi:hypothetical protein